MMVVDKKALLDEFNTLVGPQKAALSCRLPQLFQQYYAPPADLQASTANGAGPGLTSQPSKRGAPQEQAHADTKRLKQQPTAQTELDRRLESLFREVGNLINKKLMQKKESVPFREPVDINKLKIPDYYTYVKVPMDLGTVKSKLAKKDYKTPMDVCEDVRLVFRNCASYNQPGSHVRNYGDMLSDVWEKAWAESRIEERWAEIMFAKDPTGCAVPLKVAHLSSQLKSAINLIPASTNQPADTLSDLDKRKLSIQLAELQGEQLAGLLSLIQDDLPASGADDEIELDLDALPVSTLLKMQVFVNSSAVGRPAAVPPNKQASQLNQGRVDALPHAQRLGDEDMAVAGSSGQTSPAVSADSQEVKGSTMDDPNAKGPFVWASSKAGVDESATAPNASSSILRDRTAARKTDVHVNAANWDVAALQPGAAEQDQDEVEDEMWVNFKSKEEQKRQQAEEQRKLKEQQEEEIRKAKDAQAEEARRAASEAEERERALQEEEARLQAEQQRARMEQCDKEVDEIKARQGTANLVQRDDMQGLVQVQPNEGDLAAVGLTYRNDDDDVNFDDE